MPQNTFNNPYLQSSIANAFTNANNALIGHMNSQANREYKMLQLQQGAQQAEAMQRHQDRTFRLSEEAAGRDAERHRREGELHNSNKRKQLADAVTAEFAANNPQLGIQVQTGSDGKMYALHTKGEFAGRAFPIEVSQTGYNRPPAIDINQPNQDIIGGNGESLFAPEEPIEGPLPTNDPAPTSSILPQSPVSSPQPAPASGVVGGMNPAAPQPSQTANPVEYLMGKKDDAFGTDNVRNKAITEYDEKKRLSNATASDVELLLSKGVDKINNPLGAIPGLAQLFDVGQQAYGDSEKANLRNVWKTITQKQWLENTQWLKGAISDYENRMLQMTIPNDGASPEFKRLYLERILYAAKRSSQINKIMAQAYRDGKVPPDPDVLRERFDELNAERNPYRVEDRQKFIPINGGNSQPSVGDAVIPSPVQQQNQSGFKIRRKQ